MADSVDQSQSSTNASAGFGEFAGARYRGMGFKPDQASLTGIAFDRNKGIDGVKIYLDTADSDSIPDNSAGSELYSWVVPGVIITGNFQKFPLDDEQTLTVDDQYCFYIAPWDSANDVYEDSYQDMAWYNSDVYADGKPIVNSAGTWAVSDSGNLDAYFSTYYSDGTCENVVENSTFEDDTAGDGNIPSGWSSYGGSVDYKGVASDYAVDGSKSFKISHSSSADSGIKIQISGLTSSTDYTLSAWVKTDSSVDNANLTLDTSQDGAGGSSTQTLNVGASQVGRVWTTLTLDSTKANIFLGLGSFGSGSDGTVWWDGIMLEEGSQPTSFCELNTDVDASASDSASVSDTLPSYSQTEPVSVSDLATIEIVYPDLLPTVSDSVSATDTPSLEPIEIVTNVSDTVSVSDSASISIQSAADTTVTALDTASVADTPVLTVSDPQAIASDTVSVTDSPTVSIQAVPDLNVSASDTVSIADTLPSYEYTEPVSVIDSPTVQPQGEVVTRSVSASETINVDEVFQAAIEVNASVSDSVTVSDDPIISVVALDTPSPSVSDLVGVTDTPTVSVQPTTTPEVTASDSVSVNDSASVDIPLGVTVQENVSVTDTPNAKASDLIMNISDSVSVSESVTLNVSGTPEVSVSDSVSVSENTSINIYTPGEKLSFIVLDLGQVIMEI